jgi:thiamine-phosphate pyrophosphorylase
MKLVVITCQGGEGRDHLQIAEGALGGGCRAVQLRDKELGDEDFVELAARMTEMCRSRGALLFVNDRVGAVLRSGADGVHLGVEDVPVYEARSVLGESAIIGFSPENTAQARKAVEDGADYLGVGPVFGSTSKGDSGPEIGTVLLAEYCRLGVAPVIAVGGIDEGNAQAALAAGASGVAVLSAVAKAGSVERAVERLMKRIEGDEAGNG